MRMRPSQDPRCGVTLIELIVVIFIVALISTMAVMTFPPIKGDMHEAETLARRLHWARQEALASGEVLGVQVTETGYAFLRYRLGEWRPVEGDRALAAFDWRDGTHVALTRNEHKIDLSGDEFRTIEAPDLPQIWLHPTGEATAFTLSLSRRAEETEIRGRMDGSIEVIRDAAR